jgi:isoquinoline 1-oxidoreductase beta subunit
MPEINAWVVVKPDDTVIIRIARSEMGQGTLTGLAQLVAEELDANWAKVTTEYPTPGQNLARNRAWGNFGTGGSQRHPPVARLCAQGRRHRPHDAGAGRGRRMESAGRRMHGRQQRHHPHAFGPQDQLRQGRTGRGQGGAARNRGAQGPERLEARRQAPGAAGHRQQGHRQADLRQRPRLCPACSTRPSRTARCSAARSKASTRPRSKNAPASKRWCAVGDSAVAVVADTWWRAKTALDALPIEWDNGPNANSSASIKALLKAGLDAAEAIRRQPERRRQAPRWPAAPASSKRCIPTRTRTTPPWSP